QRLNDLHRCDLETMTWARIPGDGGFIGDVPTPRYFHSCAVNNGSMYVFGGYDGSHRLGDLFEHNLGTGTWTKLVRFHDPHGDAPTARSSLVAHVHENSPFIFGGYNNEARVYPFVE
ncbi:unnamed protein product, partial [Hapterophycus canaliculatus]